MHWEAFKYICSHYAVQGCIISDTPPEIPNVHKQLGWVDPTLESEKLGISIYQVPDGDREIKAKYLCETLKTINPDVIWVQEEPTNYFLFHILKLYFFNQKTRIVTAVCENIFPKQMGIKQLIRQLLWLRLNGLMAVATTSIEGIQAVGFPKKIPTSTLVAGNQSPPKNLYPLSLPFAKSPDDFVVGFVGRICEEKGWKILLQAISRLPSNYRCIIVGDGEQINELKLWLEKPELKSRVFHMGLLPKLELWRFYLMIDCLVVPSLTTSTWKEQFGGVLTDGMAMGIPIIGSDSGAIPEVLSKVGLITAEGNVKDLVSALQKIYKTPRLRKQLSNVGKQRFNQEFSIPAYAQKIANTLAISSKL
ncbi:MAG: glycosyltransferase family 4 protein [Pseudanabaena sp.]